MITKIKAFIAWVAGTMLVGLLALSTILKRQRDAAREAKREAERRAAVEEADALLHQEIARRRAEAREQANENETQQQKQKTAGTRPDLFGDDRLRDD